VVGVPWDEVTGLLVLGAVCSAKVKQYNYTKRNYQNAETFEKS
jgi:hypothetical protein